MIKIKYLCHIMNGELANIRTFRRRRRVVLPNQHYKFVLLVHPTLAVQKLRGKGKIDAHWWENYRARRIKGKEPSYQELMERNKKPQDNVVPFSAVK